MYRHLVIAVATAAFASPLTAQEPPKPEKPPRVYQWNGPDHPEARSGLLKVMNRRARLGISVNLRARATDSIGAYVNSVTPGGPAAKAGIKSGDIITKLDGTSLLGGRTRADQDESAPGLRLIELAARLEPDDTIAVELRRDKDRKTLSLVTGDEPSFSFSDSGRGFAYSFHDVDPEEGARRARDMAERFQPEIPMGDRMRVHLGPEGPMFWGMNPDLEDLELAPINPDLGRYFGVTEGILVISVPDDSKLSLKAGDVVLSIDGRTPSTPTHLLRILRSYEAGESFKLDIMRMKKKETVTGKIGEKSSERRKVSSKQ